MDAGDDRAGLFRTQALVARQRRALTGPLDVSAPELAVLLALICTLTLLGLSLALSYSYPRTVSARGVLTAGTGVLTITAPMDGEVAAILVAEGDQVATDAPLLRLIRTEQTTDSRDVASARLGDLAARERDVRDRFRVDLALLDAELDQVAVSRLAAERELAVQESAAAMASRVERIAEDRVAQLQQLVLHDAVPAVTIADAESEALAAAVHRLEFAATIARLESEISRLQQSAQAALPRRDRLRADLRAGLMALEAERLSLGASSGALVQAPVASSVAAAHTDVGQAVRAGQVLFTLLPAGTTLEATLAIAGRDVSRLRAGQRVRIRYAAFPYLRYGNYGGTLAYVSPTPSSSERRQTDPTAWFKARVVLEEQSVIGGGHRYALAPGMALRAEVTVEQIPIWALILESMQLGERGVIP